MALSDDQKAMLRLLAQREDGYEDMAKLMGISVEEVRAKVKEAVAEIDEPPEPPAQSPAEPHPPVKAEPDPPSRDGERAGAPSPPPVPTKPPEPVSTPAAPRSRRSRSRRSRRARSGICRD